MIPPAELFTSSLFSGPEPHVSQYLGDAEKCGTRVPLLAWGGRICILPTSQVTPVQPESEEHAPGLAHTVGDALQTAGLPATALLTDVVLSHLPILWV